MLRRTVPAARSTGRCRPRSRPASVVRAQVQPRALEVELPARDHLGDDLDDVVFQGRHPRAQWHVLGAVLGTGAHLAGLRRTASGTFTLADSRTLEELLGGSGVAAAAITPMAESLRSMPAVRLDARLVERVRRGQDVPAALATDTPFARLLTPEGGLAAIAEPGDAPGVLHPVVVLM